MASSEFKKKTIKGLRWGTIDQMSSMLLTQLTNLVLMRILGPEEFGVIGLANIFANFGNILVIFGIPAFVIQRKELNDRVLSTCFWSNLMLGFIVAGLLVVISPWAADFFREPRVKEIIMVLSIFFIIEAFSYIQRSLLNRELDMKSMFIARFVSTAISCAIAIWAAFELMSVWAIVIRIGIFKTAFTLMTFLFNRWIPKFSFDRKVLREVFQFTIPLLGSNSVEYFIRNFDTFMVGRSMSTSATGIYQRSFQIMQMPATNISHAINRVMMSSFSRIQDNQARIVDTYLKVSRMTAYITFPLMVFIIVEAPNFVLGILGTEWAPMIPIMQIMSVGGIVISISALSPNIFISKGRTRVHMYNTLITSAFLVTGVVVGIQFGLTGVAIGVALAMIFGYVSGIYFVSRLIPLSILKNVKNYLRVAAATLLFGAVLYAIDRSLYFFFTEAWIQEASETWEESAYRSGQLIFMLLCAIPLYWGCTRLFKTDYSAQLLEDFLSKRILDKFKNIFTR